MSEEVGTRKTNIHIILITGLVSLVVGVGSGVLINYLTEKRPILTYDITTQEVFPGQQNNIGIFAIRISNDGKRELEQLSCNLQFSKGIITEKKLTGIPNSAAKIDGTDNGIEVTAPFLNPGESFSIQALIGEIKQPFPRPTIEVRGKGVLGTEAQSDKKSKNTLITLFPVVIAVLVTLLTAFTTLTSRVMKRRLTIESIKEAVNPSRHQAEDQRDALAFTLEISGLNEDAQFIREWPRKISYWAASDTLCFKWLKDGEQDRIKMGINSLEQLIDYASIAGGSERIILLNMAKLALAIGDVSQAEKHIASARTEKDEVIEKRIQANSDLAAIATKNNG